MTSESQNELKRLLASNGNARVSLALYDLASGYQLLVRPDEAFDPASTFKVGVMMEVFHQAAKGVLRMNDRLPVKNTFTSLADGSPFSLSPQDDAETDLYQQVGRKMIIRELARRMIIFNSALATNLLIEKVGMENATRFMQELGTDGLVIRRSPQDKRADAQGLNNSATARSLMQILVRLAKHKVVSQEASEEMIDILLQQHSKEGIPAQLPPGIQIAHQTGWKERLYHDAAIVYPSQHRPYVLVIMTSGLSEAKEAPAVVASLSRVIYHLMVNP